MTHHSGPWAHPPRKPERMSPAKALAVWIILSALLWSLIGAAVFAWRMM